MQTNRRRFVMGVGTAIAGLSMGSSVLATGHTPLYFETVDEEGDFVVIGNAGDEDFDLSGYVIDWEYGQPEDQIDEIPEGIVVPAGGTVKLASGYDEAGAADADHDFGYEDGRIRDEGTDTIAIHEPGMETLVITSGDHQDPPEDPNGDDGDNGDGDDGDDGDGDDGDDDDGDDDDNGDVDDGDDGDDDRDDDGDDGDDSDEKDEDDREAKPEEEEREDEDCPEEERKKEESNDDDCPEEEPEPEPEEEDCP